MLYQIIEIESNAPILDDDGNVRRFDTPNEALELIIELSQKTFKKYKPEIIVDNSWKYRELKRFNSGDYVTPKWTNYAFKCYMKKDELTGKESKDYKYQHKDWLDLEERPEWIILDLKQEHYLHVSNLEPSKIAFTETPQKGMLDRQTQMNVASYLVNHANVDNDLARFIAMLHANEYSSTQVLFAESSDDIANVYANGPNSCMGGNDDCRNKKKDDDYFDSFCHPCRVYGDSDFKLAYLKDKNGKINARSLVLKDSKYYTRLYGDTERLGKALKDMGYEQSYSNMEGKRIRKIWDSGQDEYVLPYIDGIQTLDSESDNTYHIITTSDYNYIANSTHGFGEECKEPYTYCYNCNDPIETEYSTVSVYVDRYDSEYHCEYCASRNSFICESTNDRIHNDHLMEVDGLYYARWNVEGEVSYCDYNNTYTFGEVSAVFVNENDIEYWSNDILDDESFICRVNGERYSNRLMIVDDWNDSPRAAFNIPDDQPLDSDANVIYRCHDRNQLRMI